MGAALLFHLGALEFVLEFAGVAGRTAELLADSGGVPARIGRHWFEAGEAERAASWLQRAMHEFLRFQGSLVFPAVEERLLQDPGVTANSKGRVAPN